MKLWSEQGLAISQAAVPGSIPAPASPTPAPTQSPDFPEREDTPEEAEELERQQDA